MKKIFILFCTLCMVLAYACTEKIEVTDIPLPEHPRPDFERSNWMNLNGSWNFTFDESVAEAGLAKQCSAILTDTIIVPFPWGSKLSGMEDKGDIAWYARQITVPREWKGKRIFVVVGASDWETRAWFAGKELGSHQGGYTPFEFELTDEVSFGKSQQLMLRVDDTSNNAHLYGKQGYGNARGIWQTVYLEARGENYIKSIHFTPDIDKSTVKVDVKLDMPAQAADMLTLTFKNGEQEPFNGQLEGQDHATFEIPLKDQHLWNLDDPYLYEMTASITRNGAALDEVDTYFGQRKIGVAVLPGTDYNYIALNNKPIYMQLCLDQSYHPEGFYTFPSDEFMKNEILLSKQLGLNGNRIHIKVEIPRKLYWADKLGLLIMADVPNFWGAPIPEARADWENCMRAQVERDYNHPSIFAWIDFNETWGLYTNGRYTTETQDWVRGMYHLTKELDPSRLVEDVSACHHDHVETDINSWHAYCAGWTWDNTINEYDQNTFPGSTYNFINGNRQDGAPMINSECGNVWGYDGSAGDCDYTWDYHIMINSFRQHPKCAGWLYTEHHDVINEWNGYVRYDRTPKIDGMDELVPGMSIKDFQSPYYIVPQCYLCMTAKGGEAVDVPLYASFTTDQDPGQLTLTTQLVGWNQLGELQTFDSNDQPIPFEPYLSRTIGNVTVNMPREKGLYLLRMVLKNDKGKELHHNFTTFRVKEGKDLQREKTRLISFEPASFTAQEWSVKQSNVMDGLKVNGFGNGYLEYTITLPKGIDKEKLASATLVFEASAKQLFGKDKDDNMKIDGDYMLGKGTNDPCKSPNAYSMTDTKMWPSAVKVSVNGKDAGSYTLTDDPADHRGILSWMAQPHITRLNEAGSYGQLIKANIPLDAIQKNRPLCIRLTVPADVNNGMGGLALYGKDFGRYPMDPTLILIEK